MTGITGFSNAENAKPVLTEILKENEAIAQELEGSQRLSEIRAKLKDLEPTRDFHDAISHRGVNGPVVISEFKQGSPSKGDIRPGSSIEDVVQAFERGGASAMSVLTDPAFLGENDFIARAKVAQGVPVMRKGFFCTEAQMEEAAALGSDAALVITSFLEVGQVRDLVGRARELGMACLVETHNEEDIEKAIEGGAEIIGINNRDLTTFGEDIHTTGRLVKHIPETYTAVAESSIHTRSDVELVSEDQRIKSILVGTGLMKLEGAPEMIDIENRVRRLLGEKV